MAKQGLDSTVSSPSCWGRDLQNHTKYTSADLKSCSKNYFQLADLIQKSDLQSILQKFTQPKYMDVTALIGNVISRQNAHQIKIERVPRGSVPRADSCDKSTRGGSSAKQAI